MAELFSRGFRSRRQQPAETAARLPPGQYLERDFPVLSAGPTPVVDTARWQFSVEGLVERPRTWSWAEVHDLPSSTFHGDIHCVTKWSKFDTTFGGVSVDTLLDVAGVRAEATHALVSCYGGYTTNLALTDLRGGQAWLVWDYDGAQLPREHGGPARLLVPHLYFWKSAKWARGLRLLDHNEPGFWEQLGYHDRGDPWQEQRYAGD